MEERNEMKWGWRWGSRMGTEAGVCEHCGFPLHVTHFPHVLPQTFYPNGAGSLQLGIALGFYNLETARQNTSKLKHSVPIHRNICSASRAWLSGWSICFHFVARGCRLATLAWDVTLEFQRGGLL
ncbi:hypothetical protein Peur_002722 [Populus x canadensis]